MTDQTPAFSSDESPRSARAVPAWEQDIIDKCEKVGAGIMVHVLSILVDRGEVDAATIESLTPEDIVEHYDAWIGPAIDKMERNLMSAEEGAQEDDGPVCEDCGASHRDVEIVARSAHHGDLLCDECDEARDADRK